MKQWLQCFVSNTWLSNSLSLFVLIPASLLMDAFPLQTMVNTWQRFNLFFKACTKGCVYSQLILIG